MGRISTSEPAKYSGHAIVNLKNILVFTSTRADFGIMYWLMKDLKNHSLVNLQLLVSGTHMSREYGSTYIEIQKHGFNITESVEILPDGNEKASIAKTVGHAVGIYTDILNKINPDVIIVLGDRYETFAVVQAAFFLHIPIVHLHGGEITEGANDDRMRHAITKISDLHFTSCDIHRRRVIQLGESKDAVIVSGAPGLEHITRSTLPDIDDLSLAFKFDFSKPFILISYHPVTNMDDSGIKELKEMLRACSEMHSMRYVLSLSNADLSSSKVNEELQAFRIKHSENSLISPSFGHFNFLAIMSYAVFIIGNSSSGVIEAPSLNTPSIDVGIRQKGRERAKSVISCKGNSLYIKKAIEYCLKNTFSETHFINPYYKNNSSEIIIENTLNYIPSPVKKFYDQKSKLV